MTTPHPALFEIAAGRPADASNDEAAFLLSCHEHRMVGAALEANENGQLALGAVALETLGIWDLGEQREHLRFWRTHTEVREALRPLGVEVAVLKGIATEARWYDHLGQRVTTDLDLFLDPAALPHVREVIEHLDPAYGPTDPVDWLVRRRLLPHVDLHVGATQVDLHFDPLKVGVPIRQLHRAWSTTEELPTARGTIRVLSPDVELVLLLLHLNKDRFSYLGPFLDIARIVAWEPLAWDRVAAFVDDEGLEVPVWMSLAKVADILDLDVPVTRPAGPRARSWSRLWGTGKGLGGDAGRAAAKGPQRLLPLHFRGRPGDVLASLRREFLPHRQLLEVAGRLDHQGSYLRHLPAATRRHLTALFDVREVGGTDVQAAAHQAVRPRQSGPETEQDHP